MGIGELGSLQKINIRGWMGIFGKVTNWGGGGLNKMGCYKIK